VLSSLLVLAGFRDQGVGTRLIAEGERLLRTQGLERSRLMLENSLKLSANHPADAVRSLSSISHAWSMAWNAL
jgi:GNAT superfamily N-acetyltransferase